MPYSWTETEKTDTRELHLWPHQSMSPNGFALFITVTFAMLLLPLFPLLGTVLVWGLLPFLMLAVGGIWLALGRNQKNAQILEVLHLSEDRAHLVRHNPKGHAQEWACNRYWATASLHSSSGPVPNYVTLKGGGREVEIGAFLSEEERIALYDDLKQALRPDRP
ncbi:MAG: DUF2244 domain-containing protein [Arenibacterium sp.]